MFRRPLSTGCWDVESTTANFGLSVPPPLASSLAGAPGFAVKRPICAYVKPWVASRVWMRMYCAKQRASPPVSIVLPATLQLGRLTDDGSFAAFASALIALGVMSPVPTIASAPRLFWTVLRPLKPRTIAATPNATRMMLAAIPPYSKSFVLLVISRLLSRACRVESQCVAARRSRHPSASADPMRLSRRPGSAVLRRSPNADARIGAAPHAARDRDRDQLRAVARSGPRTDCRSGRAPDGRAVCGARRHRPDGDGPRTFHHDGNRRRDTHDDRRRAARPWDPRRADPRRCAAPSPRHPRGPAVGRLPAGPSPDADVPRRPDPAPRRRVREPVSDGEDRRDRLHRGGRGGRLTPRRTGGRRDRECPALRVGHGMVAPARVAERDRQCASDGAGRQPAARPRCAAAARADRRAGRGDRAAGGT